MGLVAALLAGPDRQAGRSRARYGWLATVPLLGIVLGACLVAATLVWPAFSLISALKSLLFAAVSTLLCLILAMPAAWNGPGPLWLVPAWLAASVGAAGWSLMGLPQTAVIRSAQAAILSLPFMVAGLSAAIAGAPPGVSRAASASGAGPLTTLRLLTRTTWPGTVRTLVAVFLLSTAFMASAP